MKSRTIGFAPMTENDLDWVEAQERELHAFPWTRGNFADSLAAGYSAWLMRVDRVAVAYAVMLFAVDEAHLLNLSVVREAHRTGMGTLMLRYMMEEARRRNATQFFLEVRPSNVPALALYQREGLQPIGRRKSYYPVQGGGREDAIVMRTAL